MKRRFLWFRIYKQGSHRRNRAYTSTAGELFNVQAGVRGKIAWHPDLSPLTHMKGPGLHWPSIASKQSDTSSRYTTLAYVTA
jgi:hypothetical protein